MSGGQALGKEPRTGAAVARRRRSHSAGRTSPETIEATAAARRGAGGCRRAVPGRTEGERDPKGATAPRAAGTSRTGVRSVPRRPPGGRFIAGRRDSTGPDVLADVEAGVAQGHAIEHRQRGDVHGLAIALDPQVAHVLLAQPVQSVSDAHPPSILFFSGPAMTLTEAASTAQGRTAGRRGAGRLRPAGTARTQVLSSVR